jgi:adenylate kinase
MKATFIGPPGAGKGTQAKLAAKSLGILHLSTGDMLRSAVKAGTKLGKEAEGYMAAGKLVPDTLVLEMLKERLKEPDTARGFILDGFPRNVQQAEALSKIVPLDLAVYFHVPLSDLLVRLVERRTCPKCGRLYNLKTQPPRKKMVCDDDDTKLTHRPDDTESAVTTRFEVYEKETAPLLELYRQKGLLRVIPATGEVDEIQLEVISAMRK